ncbi:MAG: hypothetical protein WCS52_02210 [bacterium]
MNKVLKERSADIATAMSGLCDAVGKLSLVRDCLAKDMKTTPHGSTDELLLLNINRTIERLTAAAAIIPDECWAIMITGNAVGGHEVQKRVETLIRNTMIINKAAQSVAA